MPEQRTESQEFGRYLLRDRLAVGGMAELYRAQVMGSHGPGKTVVIKRIFPHLAENQAFLDMFVNEAKVMVKLDHPRIVQVFDFGHVDGSYYIAMEYIDGIDGLALLRRCAALHCRPAAPLSAYFVASVLEGLEYAHQLTDSDGRPLNIVHRDVSPSNVFVSNVGEVKLGDFGIAKGAFREVDTQAGVLKGKLGYMAPEQVAGQPVDHRADLFAAGILLAELLMIRRLFSGKGEVELLLQVRDACLDQLNGFRSKIPDPLWAILMRALKRDPDERYQSAAEFRSALVDYLRDEGHLMRSTDLARFTRRLLERAPSGQTSGEHPAVTEAVSGRPMGQAFDSAEQTSVSAPNQKGPVLTDAPPGGPGESESDDGTPSMSGNVAEYHLISLACDFAKRQETGLLVVRRDDVSKRIFFVLGVPSSVHSTRPEDLFGQYLVDHGRLSSGELSMALAMRARNGGHLGEVLVSLGLISKGDLTRHLRKQVEQRLVEAYAWTEGTFAYYEGTLSSEATSPLRLDPFELVGVAVREMPRLVVEFYLDQFADKRIRAVSPAPIAPEAFGLGPLVRNVYDKLSGKYPLSDLLKRFDDDNQRLEFARAAVLLVQAGLAE